MTHMAEFVTFLITNESLASIVAGMDVQPRIEFLPSAVLAIKP